MPNRRKKCCYQLKRHNCHKESTRLYYNLIKSYQPTPSDIKKKVSNEELQELCLRVPCRVEMHRWNPVNDYVQYFKLKGRFKTKSKASIDCLLAKAVNRHKVTMLPKDAEIWITRRKEWCQRKKDNLLRLALWKHDRELGLNASGLPLETASSDTDE